MAALGGQAVQRDGKDGGTTLGILGARKIKGGVADGNAAHMAVKGQIARLFQQIFRRQPAGGGIHCHNGRAFTLGGVVAGDVQNAGGIAHIHALGDQIFCQGRDQKLPLGPG